MSQGGIHGTADHYHPQGEEETCHGGQRRLLGGREHSRDLRAMAGRGSLSLELNSHKQIWPGVEHKSPGFSFAQTPSNILPGSEQILTFNT